VSAIKRFVVATSVGAASLALAAPAGATQPQRLCGPEVELSGIPGDLDVEVNGAAFRRPGTGPWSITFDDVDGQFTVRYFNESRDWGSSSYDVGPAGACDTTSPAAPAQPLVVPPSGSLRPGSTLPTDVAGVSTTPDAARTLPATGSGATPAWIGALLVSGGTAVMLVTRRRAVG
jgi:hypothetical protein